MRWETVRENGAASLSTQGENWNSKDFLFPLLAVIAHSAVQQSKRTLITILFFTDNTTMLYTTKPIH